MNIEALKDFTNKLNIYLLFDVGNGTYSKENKNSIEGWHIYFKDEFILNDDILEFKGKEANFKFNINDIEEFKIDYGYYETEYDEFIIKHKEDIYRFTFENTFYDYN